jgi:hypothetical protein
MRARALPEGGLVVSCPGDGSATYVRLDAALKVQWAKRGRAGGDVALLADGGFAFAGPAVSDVKPFLDSKSAADSALEDLTVQTTDAPTTTADATLTSAAGQCAKK